MKYHLLCYSLIATGTLALPGRHEARSVVPSSSAKASAATPQTTAQTTAQTTTTTSSSTTTTASSSEASNAVICGHNGMNQENWMKFDLDHWTSFFATFYPQNVNKPTEKDSDTDTFSDYMMYNAGWGNGHCIIGAPQCDIILNSIGNCKGFTGDTTMPNVYFILGAIKNLWEWATAVSTKVEIEGARWQSRANDVVNTFTSHDVSTNSETAAMALAGAVLTMIAPMTITCEPCISGMAGASALLAGGPAVKAAAAKTFPQILQDEFDNIATIEYAIYNITDVIAKTITKIATDAINTVPDNSQEYNKWHGQVGSAPQIFMNGSFANTFTADNYKASEDVFIEGMASTAINLAWQAEGIFIVTAKEVLGNPIKDMELSLLDESNRVCDDDGLCYFFIKSQDLTNIHAGKWENPMGADSLNKTGYNVDPLVFAQNAAWFQKTFGTNSDGDKTFLATVDASTLADNLLDENGDISKYVVNLPVISYDDEVPSISLDWYYFATSSTITDEEHFLNLVGHYVWKLDSWPDSYSDMWVKY